MTRTIIVYDTSSSEKIDPARACDLGQLWDAEQMGKPHWGVLQVLSRGGSWMEATVEENSVAGVGSVRDKVIACPLL